MKVGAGRKGPTASSPRRSSRDAHAEEHVGQSETVRCSTESSSTSTPRGSRSTLRTGGPNRPSSSLRTAASGSIQGRKRPSTVDVEFPATPQGEAAEGDPARVRVYRHRSGGDGQLRRSRSARQVSPGRWLRPGVTSDHPSAPRRLIGRTRCNACTASMSFARRAG